MSIEKSTKEITTGSIAASTAFYEKMRLRRSIRSFESTPVAREVIEACLLAAGTAPNGANLQPWLFVAVTDAGKKKALRVAAEKREADFYNGRAGEEWLRALAPLETNENKAFLDEAPCFIAIFSESYRIGAL